MASLEYYRGKYDSDRHIRHNTTERIDDALPTDSSVEGTFLVDGAGESLKVVNFPIRFIQRPNFTFGAELHLDSHAVAGSYPTVSCIVNAWLTDPVIDIGVTTDYSRVKFTGAQLVVVTTGPTTQRMWIHWRSSGKAIVNPSSNDGLTTDGVI